MPTNPDTLDRLALRGLADSARWFPELHDRGQIGLVVHFALGLAGEVGELIEVAESPGRVIDGELGAELADVTIYALDLVAALDRTPSILYDAQALNGEGTWTSLVVAVGQVLNLVKKLNRGDNAPELGAKLDHWLGLMLAEIVAVADLFRLDVVAEIIRKREVLNGRWGACEHVSLEGEEHRGELLWRCQVCFDLVREHRDTAGYLTYELVAEDL